MPSYGEIGSGRLGESFKCNFHRKFLTDVDLWKNCQAIVMGQFSHKQTLDRSENGCSPGRGVLPLWPNRGVQSGLKRVKAKI